MGWLYMLVNVAAVVVWFGMKPDIGFIAALALLAVSFATFCLLYDEPVNRARFRIAQQLGRISATGVHAEEYQRLQSTKVKPTDEDRKFRLSPMSGANVAAGIAGAIVLAWGLAVRYL